MLKFGAAFSAGALTALVIVLTVMQRPALHDRNPQRADQQQPIAENSQRSSTDVTETTDEGSGSAPSQLRTPGTVAEEASVANDQPAASVMPDVAADRATLLEAASGPEQASSTGQIPVPAEIEPFLRDPAIAALHDRLESEPREASWAPYLETQIASYIAENPSLAEFSVPLIECRRTLCELQAIGYGDGAAERWFPAALAMREEPWAAEFGEESVFQMGVAGPGVVGILMIFHRPDGDSVGNSNVLSAKR